MALDWSCERAREKNRPGEQRVSERGSQDSRPGLGPLQQRYTEATCRAMVRGIPLCARAARRYRCNRSAASTCGIGFVSNDHRAWR